MPYQSEVLHYLAEAMVDLLRYPLLGTQLIHRET